MKSIIVLAALFLGSISWAQGFKTGNIFTSQRDFGRLSISCLTNPTGDPMVLNCTQSALGPTGYDYFIGPVVDADTVELSSDRANPTGKPVVKSSDYSKGISRQFFNLWSSMIFQKPLLAVGTNTIAYRLLKGNVAVQTGIFQVVVGATPLQFCADGSVTGSLGLDCDDPYSVCQKYFQTAVCNGP